MSANSGMGLPVGFWDDYLKTLDNYKVKQKVMRWYVMRAEQYLKSFEGRNICYHCSSDVIDYVSDIFTSRKLTD